MEKKTMVIAGVLFIAFVVGLIWLAGQDSDSESETAGSGSGARGQFSAYAEELGLDGEQFLADMDSDATNEKIAQDSAAGNAVGVQGTPTFAINGVKIDSPRSSDAFVALIEQSKDAEDKEVISDSDNITGNSDGAVTITEYSDFQCPACGSYEPIIRGVLEKTDDVRLVYRHYPLDRIHPNARDAARAAQAAANQGKFWEMHDLLFDRQKQWSNL